MLQRKTCFFLVIALLFLAHGQVFSQEPETTFDRWKKWLDEDVLYIISPEERDVFDKLTTDEERELFVEQFWRRRDTDPMTGINEFQVEHYRRIQYANERYNAGIPGWKTDRGRVYIMYGEPHRIEAHPTGGP
jgi:GWxTD domain-containing protein